MAYQKYWVLDPRDAYGSMIDFCAEYCCTFSFVINERAGPMPSALSFAQREGLEVKVARDQTRWPGGGTLIPNYSCKVYYFDVNGHSIAALKAVGALYKWVHPNLPEDLAFYRANAEPFFAVIGHEGGSFFLLDEQERVALTEAIQTLELSEISPI